MTEGASARLWAAAGEYAVMPGLVRLHPRQRRSEARCRALCARRGRPCSTHSGTCACTLATVEIGIIGAAAGSGGVNGRRLEPGGENRWPCQPTTGGPA